MNQEAPPIDRNPIPQSSYQPEQGNIGAWDFASRFGNYFSQGHGYTPMQFDLQSLLQYYQQQEQAQQQQVIDPRAQLMQELQAYGQPQRPQAIPEKRYGTTNQMG